MTVRLVSMSDPGMVTDILHRMAKGDGAAVDELLSVLHAELRKLASHYMKQAPHGHVLQTTALVNEACLKLLGRDHQNWENRKHFLRAAAQAMRHILVDYARKKSSKKRGGDRKRESPGALESIAAPAGLPVLDLLALDEALDRLAIVHAREAETVTLRYFGGLTCDESARVLGIGRQSVERASRFALAWLHRELSDPKQYSDHEKRTDR